MKLLSHASPIFPVDNPLETAEYYRDVLGFTINFKWEDPPTYVVINRDDAVGIHLVKREGDYRPSEEHVTLFVFTHDVDALYDEYQKSGADILRPLADREYGMRDFDIKDPNGFIITFGQGIDR